jgi:hypothetical protein
MRQKRRLPRSRKQLSRIVNTRKTRDRFLIVCEGERTEPLYFDAFRVPKYVQVEGTGFNTISLIKKALEIRDSSKDKYDQVWCVFDKNSFSEQDFNNAISFAEKHRIKVAYSNEAFELWYILHFGYHQSATSRDLYSETLSRQLGFQYKKNTPKMYEILEGHVTKAIQNAEKLLNSYAPPNPARNNPCTTVHLLVKELQKSEPGFESTCSP